MEYLEHRRQLGDVHQVIGALGRVQDLEHATSAPGGEVFTDQHSDSGAVQSYHFLHVEHQLDAAGFDQTVHRVTQDDIPVLELEAADQLENRDVANSTFNYPHSRAHYLPPAIYRLHRPDT
jgi:hypothetical protein